MQLTLAAFADIGVRTALRWLYDLLASVEDRANPLKHEQGLVLQHFGMNKSRII
jgi:hypothetical protein